MTGPSARTLVVIAVVAAGALAAMWMLLPVKEWVRAVVDTVRGGGVPYAAIAIVAFTGLVTLSAPASPLILGSAITFGFWGGLGVSVLSCLAAAVASFLIARYVARDAWRERLASDERFRGLVSAADEGGFRFVLLARLSLIVPASIKNYGLGLTGIPTATYAAGTAVGQAPVMVAYSYVGWTGGEALLDHGASITTPQAVLLVIGAVASLALVWVVSNRARQALGI